MRQFENSVQKVKNQVYSKVSEYAFQGTLLENIGTIPAELNEGPNPSMRCCVYHERAVTAERVQMILGGRLQCSMAQLIRRSWRNTLRGLGKRILMEQLECLRDRILGWSGKRGF